MYLLRLPSERKLDMRRLSIRQRLEALATLARQQSLQRIVIGPNNRSLLWASTHIPVKSEILQRILREAFGKLKKTSQIIE